MEKLKGTLVFGKKWEMLVFEKQGKCEEEDGGKLCVCFHKEKPCCVFQYGKFLENKWHITQTNEIIVFSHYESNSSLNYIFALYVLVYIYICM